MSSLSALLKEINIKVQEKSYSEALAICKKEEEQGKSSTDVQNSFLFWHSAGQVACFCAEWKLAEKYLTNAVSCTAPPPQHQKNLKLLCDAQEGSKSFPQAAATQMKLYAIMKEKLNFERMMVLAQNIHDNFVKGKGSTNMHLAGEFIWTHIETFCGFIHGPASGVTDDVGMSVDLRRTIVQHCLKCVGSLHVLQMKMDETLAAESKKSLSGATVLKPAETGWASIDALGHMLLMVVNMHMQIVNTEAGGGADDSGNGQVGQDLAVQLTALVNRYCHCRRVSLYTGGTVVETTVDEWSALVQYISSFAAFARTHFTPLSPSVPLLSPELVQLLQEVWWLEDSSSDDHDVYRYASTSDTDGVDGAVSLSLPFVAPVAARALEALLNGSVKASASTDLWVRQCLRAYAPMLLGNQLTDGTGSSSIGLLLSSATTDEQFRALVVNSTFSGTLSGTGAGVGVGMSSLTSALAGSALVLALLHLGVGVIGYAMSDCSSGAAGISLQQMIFLSAQVERRLCYLDSSVCSFTTRYPYFIVMLQLARVKILTAAHQTNQRLGDVQDTSKSDTGTAATLKRSARTILQPFLSPDSEVASSSGDGMDRNTLVWSEEARTAPAGVLFLSLSTLFGLGMYSEIQEFAGLNRSTQAGTGTNASEAGQWPTYFQVLVLVTEHIDHYRQDLQGQQRMCSVLEYSEKEVGMEPAVAVGFVKALQPLIRAIAQLKTATKTADPVTSTATGNYALLVDIESDVLLLMGRVMLMAGGKLRDDPQGGCVPQLVNAAKLNPHNGKVYTCLGHFYTRSIPDKSSAELAAAITKGVRCYQKAVELNPQDDDAGPALTQHLLTSGPARSTTASPAAAVAVSKALQMLDKVTQECSYASWAFARRGQILLYQHQHQQQLSATAVVASGASSGIASLRTASAFAVAAGDDASAALQNEEEDRNICNEAIVAFQVALELRSSDATSWFGLACAYLAQGNYNSAHKALSKVLIHGGALDAKVLCMLGEVERRLGLMYSALDRYYSVGRLSRNGTAAANADNVAAQGAAEVCHALALQCIAIGWTDEAARYLLQGVAVIDRQVLDTPEDVGVDMTHRLKLRSSFLIMKGKLCSLFYYCGVLNACKRSTTDSERYDGQGDNKRTSQVTIEGLTMQLQQRQQQQEASASTAVVHVGDIVEAVVTSVTDSEGLKRGDGMVVVCNNMLQVGEQAFSECVSLLEKLQNIAAAASADAGAAVGADVASDLLAECWYDIGVSRCCQLRLLLQTVPSGDASSSSSTPPMSVLLRRRGVDAFISGLQQNSRHAGCWNGLGYLYGVQADASSNSDHQATLDAAVLYLVSAKLQQQAASYNNIGVHLLKYCRGFMDCRVTDADVNGAAAYVGPGEIKGQSNKGLDGLLKSARDCFSMVQLGGIGRVDNSECTWVNVGVAYELEHNRGLMALLLSKEMSRALKDTDDNTATDLVLTDVADNAKGSDSATLEKILQSAYDAYTAAMEIRKPPVALLFHAKTWLQLQKYVSARLSADRGSVMYELVPVSACALADNSNTSTVVLHQVQHYAHRSCFHNPFDASAWYIYAWALEYRHHFHAAQHALMLALECVLHECSGSGSDSGSDSGFGSGGGSSSIEVRSSQVRYILRAYCCCGLKRFMQSCGSGVSCNRGIHGDNSSAFMLNCVVLPQRVLALSASCGDAAVQSVLSQFTTIYASNNAATNMNDLELFSMIMQGVNAIHPCSVAAVAAVDGSEDPVSSSSDVNSILFDTCFASTLVDSCRNSSLIMLEMLLLLVGTDSVDTTTDTSTSTATGTGGADHMLVAFAVRTVLAIAFQICPAAAANTNTNTNTNTTAAAELAPAQLSEMECLSPLARHVLQNRTCLLGCFKTLINLTQSQLHVDGGLDSSVMSDAYILQFIAAVERVAAADTIGSAVTRARVDGGVLAILRMYKVGMLLVPVVNASVSTATSTNEGEDKNADAGAPPVSTSASSASIRSFVLPRGATRSLLEMDAAATDFCSRDTEAITADVVSPLAVQGAMLCVSAVVQYLKAHATVTGGITASDIETARSRLVGNSTENSYGSVGNAAVEAEVEQEYESEQQQQEEEEQESVEEESVIAAQLQHPKSSVDQSGDASATTTTANDSNAFNVNVNSNSTASVSDSFRTSKHCPATAAKKALFYDPSSMTTALLLGLTTAAAGINDGAQRISSYCDKFQNEQHQLFDYVAEQGSKSADAASPNACLYRLLKQQQQQQQQVQSNA